jgi:hypothetical protein
MVKDKKRLTFTFADITTVRIFLQSMLTFNVTRNQVGTIFRAHTQAIVQRHKSHILVVARKLTPLDWQIVALTCGAPVAVELRSVSARGNVFTRGHC